MTPREDEHIGRRDLTRWPTRPGRLLVRAVARLVAWSGPRGVLLATLAVGLVVAVSMGAVAGEVYESVVEEDGVAGLDRPVLNAVVAIREPAVARVVTWYTDLGGVVGLTLLATAITLGLAMTRRSWTPLLLMGVAAGGSVLITVAGKAVVGRTRPPLVDAVPPYETSASFPSGHSLNSVVVAGVVAYLLVRRQRRAGARVLTVAVAGALAITMGLSRVYLGHHWLTDVLVAWSLGIGWLALVITGHRVWLTLRGHRVGRTPPPASGRLHRQPGGPRH